MELNDYWHIAQPTRLATGGVIASSTSLTPRVEVVRIKAGYVGQIVVAGEIAWESKPYATEHKAGTKADKHRAERLIAQYA